MPEIRRSEYGWSFRKIKYPPLSVWTWGFAIGPWIVIKRKASAPYPSTDNRRRDNDE